ncbi:MAG: amino acid adenylation domain-containing protein, partial [Chitinophagaceae bacterium]
MKEKYSLSSVQKPIWLDQNLNAGSPIYNVGGYVAINGEIDVAVFEVALNNVIKESDALRARFLFDDDTPSQVFPDAEKYAVKYADFSGQTGGKEKCIQEIEKDLSVPIPLNQDLAFKFELYKIDGNLFFWYIKIHHILIDGWGISLLIEKVSEEYTLLKNNQPRELKQSYSYIDFLREDESYLNSKEFETDKTYWSEKFKCFENEITNKNKLIDKSIRKHLIVKRHTYDIISLEAKNTGISPLHFFLGLLYTYFSKAHQKSDLVFGTPIINRSKAVFKKTIGLFINVSPIRICINNELSFKALTQEIRKELREAFKHQKYPINLLVKDLHLKSPDELFQVTLSYEKHSYSTRFAGHESRDTIISGNHEKAYLSVFVRQYQENEDVKIDFDFNYSYWDEPLMDLFIERFDWLLQHAIKNTNIPIGDLTIIPEREKQKLLLEFNQASLDIPVHKTVIDLFEVNIAKYPDHIAITDGEKKITYRELSAKVNQLANCLIEKCNITPGDIAGIMLERSEELIISILGVLKAGAAYVPIDPDYPLERVEYMLRDSGAKLLLTKGNNFCSQNTFGLDIIEVDSIATSFPELSITRNSLSTADKLACIIYTSGSTGRPKGVKLSHASLAGYVQTFIGYFNAGEKDTMLHHSSIAFDIAIEEIFSSVCSGMRMVIAKAGGKDIEELWNIINKEKVSIISATPLLINELNKKISSDNSLRIVISGGEELKPSYVSRLVLHTHVYNTYGPTETTVCATYHPVTSVNDAACLGKPIANKKIYLLSANLELLPIGETGEICIAGNGIAEGYLNLPELTAEKFIENPFVKNEKLFRTGDMGRWSPEGNLYFSGRKDDQIKLNGHRIELGEIENALLSFKKIKQAAAAVKPVNDYKVLIAWYVSEIEINQHKIRNHLKQTLPQSMLPAYFVRVKEIPLLTNGKTDKRSLPLPDDLNPENITREYAAPNTESEHTLAEVWQAVLNIARIGIHDNFFVLGGDSIKAIQIG